MPPPTPQLEPALDALRRTTGLNGRVLPKKPRAKGVDAVVELRVDKRTYRLAVQARGTIDRIEALGPLKAGQDRLEQPALVFTPHLTDTLARKCRELDLPFLDAAGNAYLRLPGLFVFTIGDKPAAADLPAREGKGLATATALRITFALLCRPELVHATYREIQKEAGVALGAIGQTLRELQRRGYLTGARRKTRRQLVETDRLIEEWALHYPTHLRPKLNPRRFRAPNPKLWKQLAPAEHQACWGGEVAAGQLTRQLRPATATLYLPRGAELKPIAAQHRWQADPEGDVTVLEKFWKFPADPKRPELAPPLLVYADLLATLEPRNLEAARLVKKRYLDPDRAAPAT